jgi:hypothetical protein
MSTGDALQMPPTCQVFTYGSDLCIQTLVVDQTRLLLNHALSLITSAADELLTEASDLIPACVAGIRFDAFWAINSRADFKRAAMER